VIDRLPDSFHVHTRMFFIILTTTSTGRARREKASSILEVIE